MWPDGQREKMPSVGEGRVSDRYGYDRGTPIERYHIERFLSEHAQRIRGSLLEVKEARYTRRFGRGRAPTWSTSTGTTAPPTCSRT